MQKNDIWKVKLIDGDTGKIKESEIKIPNKTAPLDGYYPWVRIPIIKD